MYVRTNIIHPLVMNSEIQDFAHQALSFTDEAAWHTFVNKYEGLDFNQANDQGCTLLMTATALAREDVYKSILLRTTNVRAKTYANNTNVIHFAAQSAKSSSMIQTLLLCQGEFHPIREIKSLINSANKNGDTALMMACTAKNVSAVTLLLASGAKVKPTNSSGMNAFFCAVRSSDEAQDLDHAVTILNVLKQHADQSDNKSNSKSSSTPLVNQQQNRNGATPLHLAVRAGHARIVSYFLDEYEHEIDLRIVDVRSGKTALEEAQAPEYAYPEILTMLRDVWDQREQVAKAQIEALVSEFQESDIANVAPVKKKKKSKKTKSKSKAKVPSPVKHSDSDDHEKENVEVEAEDDETCLDVVPDIVPSRTWCIQGEEETQESIIPLQIPNTSGPSIIPGPSIISGPSIPTPNIPTLASEMDSSDDDEWDVVQSKAEIKKQKELRLKMIAQQQEQQEQVIQEELQETKQELQETKPKAIFEKQSMLDFSRIKMNAWSNQDNHDNPVKICNWDTRKEAGRDTRKEDEGHPHDAAPYLVPFAASRIDDTLDLVTNAYASLSPLAQDMNIPLESYFGAKLDTLSMSQLEVLEQAHVDAFQRISEQKIVLIRELECQKVQEAVLRQQDQFVSMLHNFS